MKHIKQKYHLLIILAILALGSLAWYFVWQGSGALQERQEYIHDRGYTVMPFDMSKVTHYFDTTADGGVMQVRAKDPSDSEQIVLIRQHLSKEANLFAQGNFQDPKFLHGNNMPGLDVLSSQPQSFSVEYKDLDDGAEIIYHSSDPVSIDAFHQWFMAQLMDHGSDAMPGMMNDQ